jgi:hypothetical protein
MQAAGEHRGAIRWRALTPITAPATSAAQGPDGHFILPARYIAIAIKALRWRDQGLKQQDGFLDRVHAKELNS